MPNSSSLSAASHQSHTHTLQCSSFSISSFQTVSETVDSKYNVFKCWPLWCHHSKLLSCSFSVQPNAYLKSRQSSAKEKCRSNTSWKLFWSQSHCAGCYWWARLSHLQFHGTLELQYSSAPWSCSRSVSVKWPSVKCDDWVSFSPTRVSCPLSPSLPASQRLDQHQYQLAGWL